MWLLAEVESWWVPYVPEAIQVIGAIILALIAWGRYKAVQKGWLVEAQAQGVDAIADGIQVAFDKVVNKAKAASKDGKLTDEEIAEARALAQSEALAVAKGPGLKWLKSLMQPTWDRLISQLVEKMKPKTE